MAPLLCIPVLIPWVPKTAGTDVLLPPIWQGPLCTSCCFQCCIPGFLRISEEKCFAVSIGAVALCSDVVTWGGMKVFPGRAVDAQNSLGMGIHHPQHGAKPPLTAPSVSVRCSWSRSMSGGRNERHCGLSTSPAQHFVSPQDGKGISSGISPAAVMGCI